MSALRRAGAVPTGTGLAFVFPGQGSQYPGMFRELLRCGEPAHELVAHAEEVSGLPARELLRHGDAAALADPHVAQLLVFVTSLALLDQARGAGWHPVAVAGHSLGEYTALVAAGVLDRDEALRLVNARGAAMAAAARRRPGAMGAVIGVAMPEVRTLCREVSQQSELAVIANVNSPNQVVVSGTESAVEELLERARRAGALRARRLPVGGAYHSPLMADAATELATSLRQAKLSPPATPMMSSASGGWLGDLATYREVLIGQVTTPVRWQDAVAGLVQQGVTTFVEVGPGRVLAGLGRENARGARHLSVHDLPAGPRPESTATGQPPSTGRSADQVLTERV
jgi:[acyl-carrier-protein] S-malonyltransferase